MLKFDNTKTIVVSSHFYDGQIPFHGTVDKQRLQTNKCVCLQPPSRIVARWRSTLCTEMRHAVGTKSHSITQIYDTRRKCRCVRSTAKVTIATQHSGHTHTNKPSARRESIVSVMIHGSFISSCALTGVRRTEIFPVKICDAIILKIIKK